MEIVEGKAAAPKRVGFWKRQFRLPGTEPQLAFDIIFGFAIPAASIAYDLAFNTGLFRPQGMLPGGYLWSYCFYCYSEFCIGLLAIGYYLTTRRSTAILAGTLAGGGCFSLLLGIAMLPPSLIGLLFYGMGVLGLTPFLSGVVFLRSARRCWLQSQERAPAKHSTLWAILAWATVLIYPAIPEICANRIIDPWVVNE